MGCGSSKLEGADDSIHVILSSEKKKQLQAKKGETAYVPRQPHPALAQESSEGNLDKLLFHAAHHNDSIDKRDLEEYGKGQSSHWDE